MMRAFLLVQLLESRSDAGRPQTNNPERKMSWRFIMYSKYNTRAKREKALGHALHKVPDSYECNRTSCLF
ncbi:hypothetical protein VNO77_27081 [Canavalia gladiata]|uniref:Secreted protein n=1 Tax=Canavalia gladiata TaxID=3824 RepID=A0AAN9KWA5_CANGL